MLYGSLFEGAQLVDISKLGLNSKIKKFNYSFICGKGYSPPSGENSFLSTVWAPSSRELSTKLTEGVKAFEAITKRR